MEQLSTKFAAQSCHFRQFLQIVNRPASGAVGRVAGRAGSENYINFARGQCGCGTVAMAQWTVAKLDSGRVAKLDSGCGRVGEWQSGRAGHSSTTNRPKSLAAIRTILSAPF